MNSQEIEDLFVNSGVVDFDPKGHYFTVNDPHKIYRIIQDKIQSREKKMLEFVIGGNVGGCKRHFDRADGFCNETECLMGVAENNTKLNQRQRAKEWEEQ